LVEEFLHAFRELSLFQSLGVTLLPIESPLEFGEQVFQTFGLLCSDLLLLVDGLGDITSPSIQGTLSFAGSNMKCESNSNMHQIETW